MTTNPDISIIIPCFNAIDKIGRCFSALRKITMAPTKYEVIFVDDCSTDGTFELLLASTALESHWKVYCLDSNSGSPSKPRNLGIDRSTGKYVYFLDCDDELTPGALEELHLLAESARADLIRAELLVNNGKTQQVMNRLRNWSQNMTIQQRRTMIISGQSSTVDSFVRKDVLTKNNIYWPEHLRMGEDTIFLSSVLAHSQIIEYIATPTYIYNRLPALTPASTQRYGRRELTDHLEVWETAQNILLPAGVDYQNCRLNVGLRVAIESMIFKSKHDIDHDTFQKLANFVNKNKGLVSSFSYVARIKEVVSAIQDHNYPLFRRLIRPRLLIAGYDLKFISDAIPELENYFDIRIDQWTGHATHDEITSLEHLKWAEYIWCEWLLGNAEWYSHNVRPEQKLVIRMHRMELGREHGNLLRHKNVDAVVAVSTFFVERLLERFPLISRKKVRLIHNYVRADRYNSVWTDERRFTLGMIGVLPSRKGLLKSLIILKELRRSDKRFTLKVFGSRAEDVPWIAKDSLELSYFKKCEEFIHEHHLTEAVSFLGHCDLRTALEDEGIGYTLSTSDPDLGFPGPESFHLAVADGFAGGGVSLVLAWPGAEYIWPKETIFSNTDLIISEILALSKSPEAHRAKSRSGLDFIEQNYSVGKFVTSVNQVFLEI
ncbi:MULTISPECIES: glycosyltransferase [unclassified Pseudomonas]|uniref:glycosyltransferase n=1 Tax=unclassified Pseudomonas TaxID=196821 RepID=UPI000B508106|nr:MULTISPECIES: glycosyltransferase [unclassified Pseudomonas]PZW44983.1 glycosyl transferase family 2 [Pseudomonas sp. URIL14HWK12:I2]TFA89691.1 glycosyl transferase family 2 [Pseudomonas sp. URIL14HWK12:I1]SNB69479.1 Glycosyltransferases involved in cell wall biogenesis [Pseudomonas sp. LAIL14HWK12:I4]